MNVLDLLDYQQVSSEKMKKNNMFQTPRFFCDIYCFEPGQEQKGHIYGEQENSIPCLKDRARFRSVQRNRCSVRGWGLWRWPVKSMV